MGNEVEQVKERLGVAEIIGEYVKLEKSGVNYKACCPFHNEKTPSFTVNTERNFWYCFGCQEGGDVFTFIQKIEGLEFREVLERLAERANVELPKFNSAKYKEERSQKQKVLDILELTTKIYQQLLIKGKKSEGLLAYLKERGLTGELIKNFRIGYAPDDWRAIIGYLLKKNYQLNDIKKTGLVIAKQNSNTNDENNYYDRFRDRITFPIIDVNGRVIGYSARIVPDNGNNSPQIDQHAGKSAKYINSPQSDIYDKSNVLYGLYQAKKAIRSSGYVIIVEGQMDVVLSHRAGIKNVVAASGTALTDRQVKILKRYTDKVKLNFDMDGAGQKATKKSIQVCLQNDIQVKIILLPDEAKDAGELVLADEKSWIKAIEDAVPVMEYYFKTTFEKYNADDIQDRKLIVRELLNIIKDIADPIEQAYWIKKLAMRSQTDEQLLTSELEKVKLNSRNETKVPTEQSVGNISVGAKKIQPKNNGKRTRHSKLQCRLLGLMMTFQKELDKEVIRFEEKSFFSGEMLKVFNLVKNKENLGEYEARVNECVAKLLYQEDEDKLTEADIKPVKEWKIVTNELAEMNKKKKIKEIELSLRQAEESDDEGMINKLMEKLKNVLS
jgi:DNA primase